MIAMNETVSIRHEMHVQRHSALIWIKAKSNHCTPKVYVVSQSNALSNQADLNA